LIRRISVSTPRKRAAEERHRRDARRVLYVRREQVGVEQVGPLLHRLGQRHQAGDDFVELFRRDAGDLRHGEARAVEAARQQERQPLLAKPR
jgi:hypothetical protein